MIDRNHSAIEPLAREVLDNEKVRDSTPGTLYLDGPTHEHKEAASAILDAAPALARAVIELAATVKRVEALANRLDQLAAWERTPPAGMMTVTESPYADGLDEAAARIRIALNGDNK